MKLDSLAEALSECDKNPLCRQLYELKINGLSSYYLCDQYSKKYLYTGSTLYAKNGNTIKLECK